LPCEPATPPRAGYASRSPTTASASSRRCWPAIQPFEQGEQTTSRKYGGLGLGLAISKGIVDLHGGRLIAQSDGRIKGASFFLELSTVPRVPEAKPATAATVLEPRGLAGRVLLVEDHADTLRLMAKLLKALGYDVTHGHRAYVRRCKWPTARATTCWSATIGLPDGSGLEIMRHLRGKHLRGIAIKAGTASRRISTGVGEAGFRRTPRQACGLRQAGGDSETNGRVRVGFWILDL